LRCRDSSVVYVIITGDTAGMFVYCTNRSGIVLRRGAVLEVGAVDKEVIVVVMEKPFY
jgi:hypothetical protein